MNDFQVFREYYPKNEEAIYLECVWETDRFILLERKTEPESKNPETIKDDIICQSSSTVEYQSIEVILGGKFGLIAPKCDQLWSNSSSGQKTVI